MCTCQEHNIYYLPNKLALSVALNGANERTPNFANDDICVEIISDVRSHIPTNICSSARMLHSQAKDKRQDWHLDESNDLWFVQCCCCFYCCCCCPPQLNSLFLFAISLRLALEVCFLFCRCTSTIWSSISTEIWQSRLHHSQLWSWLGWSVGPHQSACHQHNPTPPPPPPNQV